MRIPGIQRLPPRSGKAAARTLGIKTTEKTIREWLNAGAPPSAPVEPPAAPAVVAPPAPRPASLASLPPQEILGRVEAQLAAVAARRGIDRAYLKDYLQRRQARWLAIFERAAQGLDIPPEEWTARARTAANLDACPSCTRPARAC